MFVAIMLTPYLMNGFVKKSLLDAPSFQKAGFLTKSAPFGLPDRCCPETEVFEQLQYG
jgi:hypothetical protein